MQLPIYCVMGRFPHRQLTLGARQRLFLCLAAPKLCITVTSAAPDTWGKSANLIGQDKFFGRGASNQKNEPKAFFF